MMKDQQEQMPRHHYNNQNSLKNSHIEKVSSHQSNCSTIGYFQILSSIFVTIAKGQHILQCMRQVLVQDRSFTPLNLFHYITHNSHYMTSQNLIKLMDENNLVSNQQQTSYYLGKIFSKYEINKDNIQYTNFLNFIYPWNSGILRDVAVNKIKNYPHLEKFQKKLRPSDTVLTAFVSLLEQEIVVQKKIQAQLADPRFPQRKQLRKIIKSIKRASQKICSTLIEKSSNHISMLEIRNFIKAFIDIPEHLFLYLGRRFFLDKNGMITIESLQSVLSKSKKKNSRFVGIQNSENCPPDNIDKSYTAQNKLFDTTIAHLNIDEQGSNKKYEKQMNYRQELYRQLASTLKIDQSSNTGEQNGRTNRSKSINKKGTHSINRSRVKTANKTRLYEKQSVPKHYIETRKSYENRNHKKYLNFNDDSIIHTKKEILDESREIKKQRKTKDNNNILEYEKDVVINKDAGKMKEKQKNQKKSNFRINNLFKQYTQIFLKSFKDIEKCKNKLNGAKIDYLTIFKTIDHGKGAVNASDIRNLYVRMSGIPIDYDFHLIIQRYAQPQQQWLSYSEFVDIFKNTDHLDLVPPEESNGTNLKKSIDLSPQNMRLLAQILYLTLDLEHCLSSVSKEMKHDEKQWLFDQINSESTIDSQAPKNFINYQQLKNYMTTTLDLSISMMELMALLKRLDKSKNGVVIRQQFLKL